MHTRTDITKGVKEKETVKEKEKDLVLPVIVPPILVNNSASSSEKTGAKPKIERETSSLVRIQSPVHSPGTERESKSTSPSVDPIATLDALDDSLPPSQFEVQDTHEHSVCVEIDRYSEREREGRSRPCHKSPHVPLYRRLPVQ